MSLVRVQLPEPEFTGRSYGAAFVGFARPVCGSIISESDCATFVVIEQGLQKYVDF